MHTPRAGIGECGDAQTVGLIQSYRVLSLSIRFASLSFDVSDTMFFGRLAIAGDFDLNRVPTRVTVAMLLVLVLLHITHKTHTAALEGWRVLVVHKMWAFRSNPGKVVLLLPVAGEFVCATLLFRPQSRLARH